jgi:hypothetical protein
MLIGVRDPRGGMFSLLPFGSTSGGAWGLKDGNDPFPLKAVYVPVVNVCESFFSF